MAATRTDDISPGSSVTSSLGSSIRICDESTCSIGYLGSCESENSFIHATDVNAADVAGDINTADKLFEHDRLTNKHHSYIEAADADSADVRSDGKCVLQCYETSGSLLTKTQMTKTEMNTGSEDAEDSDDEWVIIKDHCALQSNKPNSHTSLPIPICKTGAGHLCSDPASSNSGDDLRGDIDFSEWTVLSVRIVETTMNNSRARGRALDSDSSRREIQRFRDMTNDCVRQSHSIHTQSSTQTDETMNPNMCKSQTMPGGTWVAVCLLVPNT